jgi:hypothetical protein
VCAASIHPSVPRLTWLKVNQGPLPQSRRWRLQMLKSCMSSTFEPRPAPSSGCMPGDMHNARRTAHEAADAEHQHDDSHPMQRLDPGPALGYRRCPGRGHGAHSCGRRHHERPATPSLRRSSSPHALSRDSMYCSAWWRLNSMNGRDSTASVHGRLPCSSRSTGCGTCAAHSSVGLSGASLGGGMTTRRPMTVSGRR